MSDILVVDDEKDIRELVSDILQDEGHGTRIAANSDDAFAEINDSPPDLIVLDIWLKESKLDGIDILKSVHRDNPEIPVVIISGHGNVEIAVAAVKQGAYDFIEKPFNIGQLLVVVNRALETSLLRRDNSALRTKEVNAAQMIGDSPAFCTMRSQLEKVANVNSRVLLTGPAGAGKEVAARFIHRNSERKSGPFITVNSATIDPDRMEDVLFGRETEERGFEPGLFERAHNGILFFDEVADMPYITQSKILRVLVDQSFVRVGGKDTVRVDVRVISASNKDLQQEITNGKFREELFHRLNVVPVNVPSLSKRSMDIPLLCEYFIQELNALHGLPKRDISSDAMMQLQMMDWPGNIRQLRNMIEQVLILGPDSGAVDVAELPIMPDANTKDALSLGSSYGALPLREAREMFEREYLRTQVSRFAGNISQTAKFVEMERSALHRKLKSLDIQTGNRDK